MLLKFMTMNTEDENRDEIEAQEVGITFLELIGTNDQKWSLISYIIIIIDKVYWNTLRGIARAP